jgi:MurNAc alpha-1-phosphate uridylyltransferase
VKAMILAAGLGNRMRPLTDHTPKPLLTVGNRALIEYHLLNLQRAGVREVIINLAYLGEKIRTQLGDGAAFGLDISYSSEPEPLETGGAIIHASELLGSEFFLLINGDVWCEIEFTDFIDRALHASTLHRDCTGYLMLVPNPDFHPQGDFALRDDGKLFNDPEKTHSQRFTFGGISMLKPALISDYPFKRTKFPLVEVLRTAIDAEQLCAEVYEGHWSDVGTPERLSALDAYLRRG